MDQLIEKMNTLLASSFAFYLKIHRFHWNIEGQDFHQYHEFFGDLYAEIWGSVDSTAEEIRALGSKAKGSLAEFKESSAIHDQLTDLDIQQMNHMLYRDNETIIALLNDVHAEAEKQRQYGLLNYIEGRLDTHKKHSWMLRSSFSSLDTSTNESVVESAQEDIKTYEITFNK